MINYDGQENCKPLIEKPEDATQMGEIILQMRSTTAQAENLAYGYSKLLEKLQGLSSMRVSSSEDSRKEPEGILEMMQSEISDQQNTLQRLAAVLDDLNKIV